MNASVNVQRNIVVIYTTEQFSYTRYAVVNIFLLFCCSVPCDTVRG